MLLRVELYFLIIIEGLELVESNIREKQELLINF